MQHRKRRLGPLSPAAGADANSDALSPAAPASRLGAHLRVRSGQRSLEQLPHDPERELPFELAAARGQHLELLRRGQRACLAQQPRLPDPGAALDENQTAFAGARRVEHRRERGHLRLTLEHERRSDGARESCRHPFPAAGSGRRPSAAPSCLRELMSSLR